MLRQMLVAVDFSVCGRHAARYAFEVARAIGGAVTLLHVLEAHPSAPQDLEAAHTLLRELSLLARRPPHCLIVPATSRINTQCPATDTLTDGIGVDADIARTILDVADQLGAELILIGPHGQGTTDARALGQVVQRVLLDAHVPVQVVPCSTDRTTLDHQNHVLAERQQSHVVCANRGSKPVLKRTSANRNASVTYREHPEHRDNEG